MKKSSLVLSLLMLGISVAQASQLYTITLTSAERFTDCSVVYKSSASTKKGSSFGLCPKDDPFSSPCTYPLSFAYTVLIERQFSHFF